MKKHWYFISQWYCPLCGSSKTYRERRYDQKPEDPVERHEFREVWDYCNAL